MSINQDLEQRIEELELTLEELANNQEELSDGISYLAEAQDHTSNWISRQSKDYTETIIYIVALIVGGVILNSYLGTLNKIVDSGNQEVQSWESHKSQYLEPTR